MANKGRPDQSIWDQSPEGHADQRKAKKRISLRSVSAILSERGLEPIGAICDVLPNLDPSMQARTLLALAEFVHPKLGRTVVTGADGGDVKHSIRVTFG